MGIILITSSQRLSNFSFMPISSFSKLHKYVEKIIWVVVTESGSLKEIY